MKKPIGRPSDYSEELAAAICERIASSELGLQRIAAEFGVDKSTIYVWLVKHPDFHDKYARAKESQMEAMADQIITIADAADSESYNAARLQVDTRKWLMSKLNPKKYGEKQQLEVSGSLDLAARLAKARKRSEDQ